MDCFENSALLESVQCGVYDVAQGFYDYAYSFAQGVDDAIDSLIPRLPGVEAGTAKYCTGGGCTGKGKYGPYAGASIDLDGRGRVHGGAFHFGVRF